MLQLGLIGEDAKKPAWIQLDSMDMSHHVRWQLVDEDVDEDAAIEGFLRANIDVKTESQGTRPGWQLTVLHRAQPKFLDVVLIWNHTAFDGMGAKFFQEDLLQFLNTPLGTEGRPPLESRVLRLPSSQPRLIPPVDKICKCTASPKFACSEAWKEWGPPSLVAKQLPPVTWAPISRLPLQTGFRILTIDRTTFQNVLKACKSHKTTLTGLVHGLLAFSLASQLSAADAPSFHYETPVNMRRFASVRPPKYEWLDPTRAIANIISNFVSNMDAELIAKVRARCQEPTAGGADRLAKLADVVWELAAVARADLEKQLNRGRKNNRLALMKLVSDWREQHRQTLKKPRTISWILSNLGAIDGSPQSQQQTGRGWSIKKTVFVISQMPLAAAIEVCVIATKGEELCIGFSWHEPAVSEKLVKKVVDDTQEWLNFLGAGEAA